MTEIVFILDRSGSMCGREEEAIKGFNEFVRKQREVPGEARITTILFDDQYDVIDAHADIRFVGELTSREYYPRGFTALLDAIGRAINETKGFISIQPEWLRPDQVIFVITTDGQENSSKEYTSAAVKQMITEQEGQGWKFIFLAEDLNQVEQARAMGIQYATYTNDITSYAAFSFINDAVTSCRTTTVSNS